MSAINRKKLPKPPVPPKPVHLLRSSKLPHPPASTPNTICSMINSLDINEAALDTDENSADNIDADYGYSEAAINPMEDYLNTSVTKHEIAGRTAAFLGSRTDSLANGTTDRRKQAAEFVEVRDVRNRPLPLLPGEKKLSPVTDKPWYKLVNRREGEHLVRNGVDGYFLVRPSSKGESCLTLTLWYNGRSYNIPIRRRVDGLYALGTPKDMEQSFTTVEDMIKNYQKEELVLYSNGVETGRATLKIYPA